MGHSSQEGQTCRKLASGVYLREQGWSDRLVAHHSGARFLAAAHGLAAEVDSFIDERSPVTDAWVYADQTTGPTGQPMPIDQRIANMLARHGPHSRTPQATPTRRRPPGRGRDDTVRAQPADIAHAPGDALDARGYAAPLKTDPASAESLTSDSDRNALNRSGRRALDTLRRAAIATTIGTSS